MRLVQFNVENLFLYMDMYENEDLQTLNERAWQKLSGASAQNKSLRKTWALAKCIEDMDPDILCLNEVGGEESLTNFNKHFLNNRYNVHIKEGNSLRGIDVGYLVRKDLKYKTVLISHKNRPINFLYPHENQTPSGGKSHYFSRDVLELRLFKEGDNSPRLVVMLTHLKSKLDADRVDTEGRKRREAELKTMVKIYNEIKKELGPEIPIILSGDLNGIARKADHEPEFAALHQNSDLVDICDALEIPVENRISQIQITPTGKAIPMQLDYLFVSPNLLDKLIVENSGTYFFKSELGQKSALPNSMEERELLPSDHYPMVINFKL